MAKSFGEYSWFGKTLILVALGFIVLVFFIIFLAKCTSDDKSKSQTEVSRKVKLTKEMITGLTLAITLKELLLSSCQTCILTGRGCLW